MAMMEELEQLLGLDRSDPRSVIAEDEIQQTRNTKGLVALGAIPGEIQEDGSYIDGYGVKHYAYGSKYQFSPGDKRLTANGAFSGKQIRSRFSQEELEANPFLGLDPRDYQTLMLYMQGLSRRQIAEELDVCEQTVTTRLAKSSVKACLAEAKLMQEEDLHSLVGDATEALRDAVAKEMPIATRLTAARDILKVTGHADKKAEKKSEETATTQMQKVLAALRIDVNVNTGGAA